MPSNLRWKVNHKGTAQVVGISEVMPGISVAMGAVHSVDGFPPVGWQQKTVQMDLYSFVRTTQFENQYFNNNKIW